MYKSLTKYATVRLIIVFLVVGGGLLVSLLWLPGLIERAVTKNQDIHGRYEALIGSGYDLTEIRANISQIQADTRTLYDSLPPQSEIFKVIDQLEKVAVDTGLTQTIEVADLAVTADNLEGVPVVVQLRGELAGVVEYLKRVENLRFFIQEQHLEYDKRYTTTSEDEEVAEGVNAVVDLIIYTAPPT
ncbi:type 4a pilus biogenesis protein PilO [Patescibacteria group bacterium]